MQSGCNWGLGLAATTQAGVPVSPKSGLPKAAATQDGQLKLAAKITLGLWGDVAFGKASAFAKEELLHLLFHDFLGVGIDRIQAIFVHDHFGVFEPELPGIFRDILIDALAEFAFPRHAIEAGQLLAEFHTVDHAGAGLDRFAGSG